jgi:toxin ParE1/3/4
MGARIIWSQRAEDDLRNLIQFIARNSRKRAVDFGDALLAEIEVIAEFPFSYREVPEFERPSIRELVFPPYRVIFRITKEQSIEIVRIWHAARGPVEI